MSWKRTITRSLAGCVPTYHAIDAYLRRVPGAHFDSARRELEEIAQGATYVKRRPTGEELWHADAADGELVLVVHRIARRPPILLTVFPAARP